MPPGSALDHLDGALRRLRDRPGAPRWVGRDLQHVTLAFFGAVPEATVPALTAAVGDALAVAEVHLRLTGAGTFPAKGDPRVLWVGVDGDVEELAELAAAAAEAGRSVGVPIERRAYRPHVTVGRWAHSARGDRRDRHRAGQLRRAALHRRRGRAHAQPPRLGPAVRDHRGVARNAGRHGGDAPPDAPLRTVSTRRSASGRGPIAREDLVQPVEHLLLQPQLERPQRAVELLRACAGRRSAPVTPGRVSSQARATSPGSSPSFSHRSSYALELARGGSSSAGCCRGATRRAALPLLAQHAAEQAAVQRATTG